MVKYILLGQEKAKAASLAAEVLGMAEQIESACERVLLHLTGRPNVMELRRDGYRLLCGNRSPLRI